MNGTELNNYRIEQLEERVSRIEKFILWGICSCALFSGTLMWLIIDIPNKIGHSTVISTKAN